MHCTHQVCYGRHIHIGICILCMHGLEHTYPIRWTQMPNFHLFRLSNETYSLCVLFSTQATCTTFLFGREIRAHRMENIYYLTWFEGTTINWDLLLLSKADSVYCFDIWVQWVSKFQRASTWHNLNASSS